MCTPYPNLIFRARPKLPISEKRQKRKYGVPIVRNLVGAAEEKWYGFHMPNAKRKSGDPAGKQLSGRGRKCIDAETLKLITEICDEWRAGYRSVDTTEVPQLGYSSDAFKSGARAAWYTYFYGLPFRDPSNAAILRSLAKKQ